MRVVGLHLERLVAVGRRGGPAWRRHFSSRRRRSISRRSTSLLSTTNSTRRLLRHALGGRVRHAAASTRRSPWPCTARGLSVGNLLMQVVEHRRRRAPRSASGWSPSEPRESVCPPISISQLRPLAQHLADDVERRQRLRQSASALPVSKLTSWSRIMPVSSSSVSRSITSIGQPSRRPQAGRACRGTCRCRRTRRRRRSRSGSPSASTSRPRGVSAHWSRPSNTPSPSASRGQPRRVDRRALAACRRTGRCRRTRRRRRRRSGSRVASTVAPCGRVGALVEAVAHLVAVGVGRAALRVDAWRRAACRGTGPCGPARRRRRCRAACRRSRT